MSKKLNKNKELSDEEYSKLLEDLDNFDTVFFTALSGSDKFELVPTILENGRPLSKEQYALVKTECSRLGLKVIYQISLRDGSSIFVNPENLKIGYVHEGMH